MIILSSIYGIYFFKDVTRVSNGTDLNQSEIQTKTKLKASKNITLMVIWTSAIYVIGNIPQTVAYVMSLIIGISYQYSLNYNISIGFFFFIHGINIFIYIRFNKLFRKILIGYFRLNLFSKYLPK